MPSFSFGTVEGYVADELLAALVGVFGAAVLSVATLLGTFVVRRIHELRDRIRDLEEETRDLRFISQEIRRQSGLNLARMAKAGRGRRGV